MNGQSPYASTPGAEYYYDKAQFETPTPSPRGPAVYYYAATPQRPHTRAHVRHASTGIKDYHDYPSPRPAAFSPRYNSEGLYSTNAAAAAATANVSAARSSRKKSFSGPRHTRERRSSYSQYRPSDHYGDSDEDEFVEINGVTYKLSPIQPANQRPTRRYAEEDAAEDKFYYHDYQNEGGRATDYRYTTQTASRRYDDFDRRETGYYEEPRRPTHARRASHSMPQRPQTVRPTNAYYQPPPQQQQHQRPRAPPPVACKATEADAKIWGIPKGYSLKNWDPTEEPILLLGSVFDANSLGKWIYDWTVYSRGASTPISEMAGALWLLLIELSHKIKRGKETVPLIRAQENKEMIEDFIASGQRITDKLKKLLKLCEKPMLTASASSSKKDAQLGQRSGIEFVETLFGRDRELERTEAFMQSVRVFNLRFDANCEEIIQAPKK